MAQNRIPRTWGEDDGYPVTTGAQKKVVFTPEIRRFLYSGALAGLIAWIASTFNPALAGTIVVAALAFFGVAVWRLVTNRS